MFIGMDIAASEFCKDGKYDLDFKNPESKPEDWITSDKLAEMYQGFIKDYPVLSIEDPFDQVRNLVILDFYEVANSRMTGRAMPSSLQTQPSRLLVTTCW